MYTFSQVDAYPAGDMSSTQGRLRRAIAVLERAWRFASCRSLRSHSRTVDRHSVTPRACRRVDEALPLLERETEEAISILGSWPASSSLAYLGEAYHLDDRTDDAAAMARRALKLDERTASVGTRPTPCDLGEVCRGRNAADAETHYRDGC